MNIEVLLNQKQEFIEYLTKLFEEQEGIKFKYTIKEVDQDEKN